MKRVFLALAVAALLLLVAGVGTATASSPATESAGQLAASDQGAGAAAGTAQQEPSNANGPIRVLSPGDDGRVSQTNEATSDATAANLNATGQSADQTQAGGSGQQVIGQAASSDQDALALALTAQKGASNENEPVRVLSPGDGGPVSQSNVASSDASAGNANATEQTAEQEQAGRGCCGSAGEQVIGQSADSEQDAAALAATEQEEPSNSNISVRVLSPGDDGPVSQTNEATSDATAGNLNVTKQTADQDQAGGSCKCGSGGGEQVIGQSAKNDQDAAALAATKQEKPSNSNISVRVLSPGDDGPVTQVNDASSTATAGNLNATKQSAEQSQAGGSGLQAIGQSAKSDQEAAAAALTVQKGATNENVPVRVLSKGDGGSVSQSNVASSDASAGNANWTEQTAEQDQAGGSCKCGSGLQVIGQAAHSEQEAAAISATIQAKPSNSNAPVRVLSHGDDGPVSQLNEATSDATAGNLNVTKQSAEQQQAGSGLQAIGQSAKNAQGAFALGLTLQLGASNENAPVRVLSHGDGGPVSQSNVASSHAAAGNLNWTGQSAGQIQGGRGSKCGCDTGIQAIGQLAENRQGAIALAATVQQGLTQPCRCKEHSPGGNRSEPVRVLSPGDDGPVRQSNLASSSASALNWNATKQDASQLGAQSCGCRKDHDIQAIGQLSKSDQFSAALAAALQLGSSNGWSPERKDSPGKTGLVRQSGQKLAGDTSSDWAVKDQSRHQVER